MLNSFILVGKQVIILAVLIIVGFFCGKKNIITKEGSVTLSTIMMYIVSPCMIIVAFQREKVPEDVHYFLIGLLAAAIIHIVSVAVSTLSIHDTPERTGILIFATVCSNCGFMAFPLQNALFGATGIFYGSAYVFIFNIFVWTWGTYIVTRDKRLLRLRPLIFNAGIISVTLGFLFYMTEFTIPPLLMSPITYLSALNTPIPMLIIGYQLSKTDFKTALQGKYCWISMILRLIILPIISIAICMILHLPSNVSLITIIAASAPPAAFLNMLASKYDKDISLCASIVSIQTVISIATIPLMYAIAQQLIH